MSQGEAGAVILNTIPTVTPQCQTAFVSQPVSEDSSLSLSSGSCNQGRQSHFGPSRTPNLLSSKFVAESLKLVTSRGPDGSHLVLVKSSPSLSPEYCHFCFFFLVELSLNSEP